MNQYNQVKWHLSLFFFIEIYFFFFVIPIFNHETKSIFLCVEVLTNDIVLWNQFIPFCNQLFFQQLMVSINSFRSCCDITLRYFINSSQSFPLFLLGLIKQILEMGSGQSRRHTDQIQVVMPQFEQLPRNQISFIQHILDDFIWIFAAITFEYSFFISPFEDDFIFEQTKLIWVYQNIGKDLFMSYSNSSSKQQSKLFQKTLISSFHTLDDNLINCEEERSSLKFQCLCQRINITCLLRLNLPIFFQQSLFLELRQSAKLVELERANAKSIIKAKSVDGQVGKREVLPIKGEGKKLMNSCFTVSNDESFGFGGFCFFQGDIFGIYFFDLLIEEEKGDFQHYITLFYFDIPLYTKVNYVVELHLFFKIPEEEAFGQEGRGVGVDGGYFDDLRILLLLLFRWILLSVREGMGIHPLYYGRDTSMDCPLPLSKQI